MAHVQFTIGRNVIRGILNESKTAAVIEQALPIASTTQRWGDEVYFETPVKAGEEDSQSDVPSGTIAYWPPGRALCLFFGQKPYSPVNVIGRLEGDPKVLARVQDGDAVLVEAV